MNINLTRGEESIGPCENASRGQTFHKCVMECNFDGSCEEYVSSETCDCDGSAFFAGVSNKFQVFIIYFVCEFLLMSELRIIWY